MGEANRRKSAKPKRQAWIYPHAIEREYGKRLTQWMRQLTERATLEIKAQLPGWISEYNQATGRADSVRLDDFPDELTATIDELEGLAQKAADENLKMMVVDVGYNTSDQNMKQWSKFTQGVLGVKFFPTEAWETDVINTWSQANFNLIKSLSNEYIKKVNTLVSEGVQAGKTYDEIMREMRKTNKNMSGARARLIARDQVGKLTEQFSHRRQQDAGIENYVWATVGDERVRAKHRVMDGLLCRWDDATVYSDDGGKTWKKRSSIGGVQLHPGQDIQCRCSALPAFDDIIAETDKIIQEQRAEEKRRLEIA